MASTTAEKIAVMQGYLDGKVIEVSDPDSWNTEWVEQPAGAEPTWDWATFDYRVKPGPVAVLAALNVRGRVQAIYTISTGMRYFLGNQLVTSAPNPPAKRSEEKFRHFAKMRGWKVVKLSEEG